MIVVESLSLEQGSFCLHDVSFALQAGEFGVLMGKTGSGKTSILEAICGLKSIRYGRILLAGQDVTALSPAERGVGYVPQHAVLFPHLSVADNLAFGPTIHGWGRSQITARVEELAQLLELEALLDRYPKGLSGGEAQRVALGRALACRPTVLCLDEPLSALDEETKHRMLELLQRVQRQTAITALHVTHSSAEARLLGNVRLRLHNGVIEMARSRNDDGMNGWSIEDPSSAPATRA